MKETIQNLVELEDFLSKVSLPVVRKRPLTFLGIFKQPHYENVWSNIYAFFFALDEEHGFRDLFVTSLLELIAEANGEFSLGATFEVAREHRTLKGNWIDLLLWNGEAAIIVENKVYHRLNNDLHDYWDSVDVEHRQGIVLSLRRIGRNRIAHPGFISMTHLELMQQVIGNLPKYLGDAHEKYIIFLKDFYQNIMNISNPMDVGIIQFFNRHQKKIAQVNEIRDAYVGYVIAEVERAHAEVGEDFKLYSGRNEAFRYYCCPGQDDLMVTVVFEELFTANGRLLLIAELSGELLAGRERYRKIIFDELEKPYLMSGFYSAKGSWAHFAIQELRPTEEELSHLAEFIAARLSESPILSIYRKLKSVLVEDI